MYFNDQCQVSCPLTSCYHIHRELLGLLNIYYLYYQYCILTHCSQYHSLKIKCLLYICCPIIVIHSSRLVNCTNCTDYKKGKLSHLLHAAHLVSNLLTCVRRMLTPNQWQSLFCFWQPTLTAQRRFTINIFEHDLHNQDCLLHNISKANQFLPDRKLETSKNIVFI